ncbi:MAG: hypothetical protein WDA42_03645 [Candidatus Bathyarchaeia archaeon]
MNTYQIYDNELKKNFPFIALTAQEAVSQAWQGKHEKNNPPKVYHQYGVVMCGECFAIANFDTVCQEAGIYRALAVAHTTHNWEQVTTELESRGFKVLEVAGKTFDPGYDEARRTISYLRLSDDPYDLTICQEDGGYFADSPGDWYDRALEEHTTKTGEWLCDCGAWNDNDSRSDRDPNMAWCETCGQPMFLG